MSDGGALRCPFPWWGGKRPVAPLVWPAFGADIANYAEPFCGSLAMLLNRPGGAGKIETANDLDRYLANFWRAVVAEPDAVAAHADWPVNEADLHARHRWLVAQGPELRRRMHEDPSFYDVKIAGWWVWGIALWIGSGWCVDPDIQKRPRMDGIGKGVHRKARNLTSAARPHMSSAQGVHRKLPHLAVTHGVATGRGVHAQLPHLAVTEGAYAGRGVHAQGLPSLGNDRGVHGVSAPPAAAWFRALQERLRGVRIACGDWKRILTPSVLGKGKNVRGRKPCAVFLDPPYDDEFRERDLYAEDASKLSHEVRAWALEHGDDPDLRIALCGYLDEHDAHMPPSWRRLSWKGVRGYSKSENSRRHQETIWLSPHCLSLTAATGQASLFDERWTMAPEAPLHAEDP